MIKGKAKALFVGLAAILAPLPWGGVGSGLLLTSCSDFSDYNEAPSSTVASGNQTLWENISQNAQLSDFADLLKKAGFDTELTSSRSYTVWAPLNGTYNRAAYDQLSQEDLLRQFVKSHVAEYSYAASGNIDERIHTLNEKSFSFTGNGSYTYDGISVSQPNLPSTNGVMHIIDGAAQFYPNLYEYLSMANDIDSLRDYFLRYELTVLDQDASVKGPMVDGVQTYIDSVLVTSNALTRQLRASLDNEDSTYTFLMPTNHAYESLLNRVRPYYNYITKTTVLDVENLTSASGSTSKSVTIDAAYTQDSVARLSVVNHLAFSNNDTYNQWVEGDGVYTDTLRSTSRRKFSNPRDILAQTSEKVTMSNGFARIVDSLAFYPWETYCPMIEVPFYAYVANYFTASTHRVHAINFRNVFGPDPEDFYYLWIEPSGPYAKPDFFVELPNVRSATYNFYCVFLPSARLVNDTLPNLLNFSLSYCAANGNLATYNFSKKPGDNNPKTQNVETAFSNNPEVTDTVFIGQFTFPVCYAGLGDYNPSIRVTSPINTFNPEHMANYTRDVRIWAILMKPVELDEFDNKEQ